MPDWPVDMPVAMPMPEEGIEGANGQKSDTEPTQKVRKLFPETWIWTDTKTG